MDLPDWHDYLETYPLKLTAEHFPLPRSLLKPVLERYTDLSVSAADEQAMDAEELIGYIRKSDSPESPPLDAVLVQTEAMGDPALPSIEQVAILRWLAAAQQDWEVSFPVEEPLASQIRPLRPLVAALAITDPNFLTPGAHPVHQILDTIQAAAIGWQPRLGRAGQALERQLTKVVEEALAWFEDRDTNLDAICSGLTTTAERDLTRTRRMAQRVIETEQGRVKTADAKQQAAGMINAALEQFQAPVGIGEFLKGPWYASAQLVLLKYGADSEQWQQMSATTHSLLDSLQTPDEVTEERRQYIFQIVTQLPKDLKRWLLNLHHDSEAVDDAVGLVEFAHLRVLRQQPLVMEKTDAIAVNGNQQNAGNGRHIPALDSIDAGQWFAVPDGEGPLRAQLVLKMEEQQQLLFTNQAGIKVLQLSYEAFAQLLADNRAIPLHNQASFSACLASAAGITTFEDLEEFTGAAAERARLEEERQREEAERLERERIEADRLEAERLEAERLEQERLEQERLEQERLEAERLEQERLEQERLEAERLEQERTDAESHGQEKSPEQEKIEEYLRQKQERLQRRTQEAHPDQLIETEESVLNLPMGAWLGFHDGDTPLLAKLAVHDREQDQYFFVNREGIKMRQLSKQELLDLMDRGLVDVLETNSNFREEVTRIRSEFED